MNPSSRQAVPTLDEFVAHCGDFAARRRAAVARAKEPRLDLECSLLGIRNSPPNVWNCSVQNHKQLPRSQPDHCLRERTKLSQIRGATIMTVVTIIVIIVTITMMRLMVVC